VAVGPPPSPRYGHRAVCLDKGRIAILGGCAVCPFSEGLISNRTRLIHYRLIYAVSSGGVSGGLMGMSIEETKTLFDLQTQLEHNYKAEGVASALGGDMMESKLSSSLQSNINSSASTVKGLLHSAASLAGQISDLEHETRDTELQLVLSWKQTQATMLQNTRRARHPLPYLDFVFLDTNDLVWKEATGCNRMNKQNRDVPCSRIHFAATCVAGYVIVVGGLHPTCLKNLIVDADNNGEGLRVYVLDPVSQKWGICKPKQTAQYLDGPLSIAEVTVITSV
jgi:hypothetical protein